jgi:hypothetical protein
MNSETHSCTISLASLEIFALGGRLPFMMRATHACRRKDGAGRANGPAAPDDGIRASPMLAIGRNRSCSRSSYAA